MKIYTAFLFEGQPDPDKLHCTHKYFGEVSDLGFTHIQSIIDEHFRNRIVRLPPRIVFSKKELFGPYKDIPVLLCSSHAPDDFLCQLRSKLVALKVGEEDKYEYRPHVTTDRKIVEETIVSYALMVDGQVRRQWPLTPLTSSRNVKNNLNIKGIELRPIKESVQDYEAIELRIIELFKKQLYLPLLKEFSESAKVLTNSKNALLDAIRSGRLTFNRGIFSGRFSSVISSDLKELGAAWDRKQKVWRIQSADLPIEVRNAVSASEFRYQQKIAAIDKRLGEVLPEELAGKLKIDHLFDSALWKTERDLQQSIKGITVAPQLTKEQSARIAGEWQNNMKLWIKDFTEKEIVKLRKDMQASAFAGNRYGDAIEKIKASYGVSRNKAKFLARQETSLLMTKFKETRYQAAGVNEYRWGCVAGTKNHPVRPWHKALQDKIFKWSEPPITTKPGEAVRRNNPGQDFNCRCFAKPIVKFR